MYRIILFLTGIFLFVGANVAEATNSQPPIVQKQNSTWKKVRYGEKVVFIPSDETKRCPKWENALRNYDLPVPIFSYIMWRESRCIPKAIGWNYKEGTNHTNCKRSPASTYKKCSAVSSYDSGLLQINSSWVTATSKVCKSKWGDMTVLLQPDCNLKMGKYLLTSSGLGNWGF